MKNDITDLLRQGDPAAGIENGPLDDHELAGLGRVKARIAAEEQVSGATSSTKAPVGRRPRRRTVVVAAAAALVVGVGVVVVDPFNSAPAATATLPLLDRAETAPGRPARAELLTLAAVAAKDTMLPGDAGPQHVVRTRAWNLETRVDEPQTNHSVVLPQEITLDWNSVNLSGRQSVVTGQPVMVPGQSEQAWRDAAQQRAGRPEDEISWPAGAYRPGFTYPLEAGTLAKALNSEAVQVDGTGQMTALVAALYRESTPAPAVRAAVLRALAGRGDMVALGPMTDRAGRAGVGFAVDTTFTGWPRRHVLIFNPSTGALLAEEDVLTGKPGSTDLPFPSVIGYTLYASPAAR
jgi:hypothetical protein